MKKLILTIAILTFTPHIAHAACTANAKVYSNCNAGYYLSGSSCVACAKGRYKSSTGTGACTFCPSSDNAVLVTTASTGSTSASDCYIASSTSWSFSDTTGSGTENYTSNCYYSN